MAIDVTPARVRATADLARLDLTDDEIAPFAAQLQKIVGYISELEALDLTDVPPTSHVIPLTSALRDDVPGEELDRREVLSQAPRSEHGAFVVPQFVAE